MKHVLSVLILISLVLLASCEGVGTAEFNDAPQATNSDGDTTTTGGGGGGGGGSITFAGIDSVSSKTDRSASLNWTVHADAVAYEVYRVVAGTPTLVQYINNPATVTYAVTGLSANTSYTYVVVVRDAAGDSSSLTTTTSFTTNSAPSAPTGLALNDPASSPGTDSTPTITVSGVNVGDTITLYDSTCTTSYGSAVAAAATVNVTTSALTDATYTFKATATNPSNNESSCSTATVSYEKITATNLMASQPAAAAYSLRKLNATATYAIKVRRSSDNGTQDIGFSGNDLDVTALTTFVGGGYGYVDTWYDQSGNGHHAYTNNDAYEPMIVRSGTVIRDGVSGKPTLYFNGTGGAGTHLYITNPFNSNGTQLSAFAYMKMNDHGGNRGSWFGTSGGTSILMNDENRFYFTSNGGSVLTASTAPTQFTTIRAIYNSPATTLTYHENGTQIINTNLSGTINDVGAIGYGNGRFFFGHMCELIFYTTDKSASAATIETDINTYYARQTAGTYATLDPTWFGFGGPYFNYTNGNKTLAKTGGGSWQMVLANIGKTTGKWYYEVTFSAGPNLGVGVGTSGMTDYFAGYDTNGWGYFNHVGQVYHNSGVAANYTTYSAGSVLGVAYDLDNDRVYFYVNGTVQDAAGISIASLDGKMVYPVIMQYQSGSDQATVNFGASAFTHAPPAGFNSGVYE